MSEREIRAKRAEWETPIENFDITVKEYAYRTEYPVIRDLRAPPPTIGGARVPQWPTPTETDLIFRRSLRESEAAWQKEMKRQKDEADAEYYPVSRSSGSARWTEMSRR